MTLANLIVQPDRAILHADTAFFWPDGSIACFEQKARLFEGILAALTTRGSLSGPLLDAELYAQPFASPRALLDALPGIARRVLLATVQAFPGQRHSGSFYVASYCPDAGPQGHVLCTDRRDFDGNLAPFTVASVRSTISGDVSAADLLGRSVDVCDPTSFDPLGDSRKLVSAQRRQPWGFNDGDAIARRIGGDAHHIEVTANGVESFYLWRWRDKIRDIIA